MGKWLIIAGIIMVVAGFVIHFAPGIANWFGKLPGDISFEKGNTRVYIPITSMIIISLILTIIINLIKKF